MCWCMHGGICMCDVQEGWCVSTFNDATFLECLNLWSFIHQLLQPAANTDCRAGRRKEGKERGRREREKEGKREIDRSYSVSWVSSPAQSPWQLTTLISCTDLWVIHRVIFKFCIKSKVLCGVCECVCVCACAGRNILKCQHICGNPG